MIRKQIYLEETQEKAINRLAVLMGQNASSLIRMAIDDFVTRQQKNSKHKKQSILDVLTKMDPFWQHESDEETHARFREMRKSWDRKIEGWND